ncbi:amino acid ABC transporter membrane protein, PAAT family [Pseudovibrio denitrificans]|uniref:Amino acid ABC transporter membrane protein, PAAT family n=1 Tax=Pseudovibrio denitrificans TaxID=258256 RepID=A0A1I7BM64_9HYPH|nr:amino acid ABC transporter permease [Pseudovibrio denitrificans]SFT88270.1 amino acid ABC transporter membrane protein, PAAT family [Pseudovibrio denitrificans]
MNVLRTLRPSNVILIAAMPFIIYLFVSTNNYKRSIYAIVGIGENASTLFASFLCALAIFCAGFWLAYSLLKNPEKSKASQLGQNAALIIYFTLLALIATNAVDLSIFVDSIVANSVDPYTSDLIQKAVRPRQLTPEAQVLVLSIFSKATFAYLIASLGLLLIHFLSKSKQALVSLSRYGLTLLLLTNALGAFYILFVAHAGFAAGLMVTLRAAFFAYFASMILGLIWAGLQSLEKKKHTNLFYSIAALIFFGLCAFFVMQPQQSYSLIGSLEGRVAIIKGTPQPVTDQIRFGEYDGANHTSIDIRSVKDPSHALITVEKNKRVSAAFIPTEAVPADANLIWQTSFLPDESKYPAITFGVLGFFTMLLVVCSIYRAEHPLAIAAEFFIDTVRGIPMLVIILYVGLPLSGAIKSASDGAINLSNMTRGIVAISIGYSAYMAEIFRAGILAVPKGQIEAARSLGLSRWQVARFVVLPQALSIVIPPLGNEFIAMLKDTSLLSILSVRDVTQRMREFQASSFLPFAPFNSAAILYVVLTLGAASIIKSIERRYERKSH